jgi:hypothetical protein
MVNIIVHPLESPRIIEIPEPQTEVGVQELHDAIRAWEDSFEGMSYPYLITTAGGENLGGEVTVGLTATLLNAQVYFPPRSTPIDNNETCTTADTNGRTLISSTSTFITDSLVRGDVVYNSTTGSMSVILSIDSETQISHLPLTGGTRNDWQVGDSITTYNNPQCNISGGNLVAVDDIGDDISPVLNSPLAQVIRTAASSATLQEQDAIQFASFNGGITYDSTSPYSGTVFPAGTLQQPVNNVYDAYDIAIERGFSDGFILSDLTMPIDLPLQYFTFIGNGKDRTLITVPDAATVSDCTFEHAEITGYLDGNNTVRDCLITNLYYIKGYIEGCVLAPGTITLAGSEVAHFLDCYSGQPGVNTPIIDCGGSGQELAIRNYNGGITLKNKTGSEEVSIDLNSGQVILENTVTNGIIIVRGVGKLVDSLGADIHTGTWNGVTILNETISGPEIAELVWTSNIADYTDSGTFGHFISKKLLTVAKYLGLK